MSARPVRDVFANAILPRDWEALPFVRWSRDDREEVVIYANHPMCRVLGADGQWSIFDVLRMTHASADSWRRQAESTFWRGWLRRRAGELGVPAWRMLADTGCPRAVVEEFAARMKETGRFSFKSSGDPKEAFHLAEEAV